MGKPVVTLYIAQSENLNQRKRFLTLNSRRTRKLKPFPQKQFKYNFQRLEFYVV